MRNDVDRLVTNHLEIIHNILVITRFNFSSDLKLCRGTIALPKRIKYQNYRKSEQTFFTFIPLDNVTIAKEFLSRRLEKTEQDSKVTIQEKQIIFKKKAFSKWGKNFQ